MGEIIFFEGEGIWKVDVAGKGSKELLYADDLYKNPPELSPNGRWLAYTAGEPGETARSLWLLDIDAKEAWQVSEIVPGMNWNWLPYDRLLYTEYPSFVFDPYGDEPPDFGTDYRTLEYDPATRTRTQTSTLPFGLWYAVFRLSPTEEKILARREGEDDLLLMNLDGSDAQTVLPNYPWSSFVWSPDGKLVAYDPLSTPSRIRVVEIGKGQVQELMLQEKHEQILLDDWSPNGKWVAFRSFSSSQVCVIHFESGEEKCFDVSPSMSEGQSIAWSPDSSTIADVERTSQQDTWDIYLVRISDGEVTRLTHDPGHEHYLRWR